MSKGLKEQHPHPAAKRNQGFTLMELMVAMAAGLIVLAAIYSVFIFQSKRFDQEEQISEMQQSARAAMDIMTREIRMAGYDPDGNASAGILTAGMSSCSFSRDVDQGGGRYQTCAITYSLDSGNRRVTRGYAESGNQPLAENIHALAFTYYDADGAVTAVEGNIRQIKIDITAGTSRPDPAYSLNGGYRTFQLTSMVTPRNLTR